MECPIQKKSCWKEHLVWNGITRLGPGTKEHIYITLKKKKKNKK